MIDTSAPAQVPFAPKPIPAELLSSWLLRVAAANYICLGELVDGFQSAYPAVRGLQSLDLGLSPPFFEAISRFCRVPIEKVQALDLVRRLPQLHRALLLRFPNSSWACPRRKRLRLGYAFCGSCVTAGRIIYVPWEWSFAGVTHCGVHDVPLQDGCPTCGESDPLSFHSFQRAQNVACWSCSGDLSGHSHVPKDCRTGEVVSVVEKAYREAILGVPPHPSLLGKATHRALRAFVDDMLRVLVGCADPGFLSGNRREADGSLLRRQDVFGIIIDLVSNSVPTPDTRQRRLRQERSLRLWSALLILIPASEGEYLQIASRLWPVTMQRRFDSALRQQVRRRWPAIPFQGRPRSTHPNRQDPFVIRDLRF